MSDIRDVIHEGYLHFWASNQLKPVNGAREKGCPRNTVRTDRPRSLIWDPSDPVNQKPNFGAFFIKDE